MTPNPETNESNMSANMKYIFSRLKKFEDEITYSIGKLFRLHSQTDNDIKRLKVIINDLQKQINELKK